MNNKCKNNSQKCNIFKTFSLHDFCWSLIDASECLELTVLAL